MAAETLNFMIDGAHRHMWHRNKGNRAKKGKSIYDKEMWLRLQMNYRTYSMRHNLGLGVLTIKGQGARHMPKLLIMT